MLIISDKNIPKFDDKERVSDSLLDEFSDAEEDK